MSSVLKKKSPLIMAIVAILLLVGAILILVLPTMHADAVYKKVLGWIISILMILLSLLILFYLWLGRDREPNFFLFDRQKKRNISVDELSFKLVNERLNFLLITICGNSEPDVLWKPETLKNELNLGFRKVYRPLIVYKMLYDLADKNVEDYWNYLFNAPMETIDIMTQALTQAGETKMASTFNFMLKTYREDFSNTRNFIVGNQKYIRGRIMAYIKRHIEMFY